MRKLELRLYNVMGHTYAYRDYGIIIRGDVRPDIGMLQLVRIFYIWLVALFSLIRAQHMFM